MAFNVEVLIHDTHIDGVGEVGVEDTWNVTIGEHLFNLVGIWIGRRHDES